jgi:hypothetical protein
MALSTDITLTRHYLPTFPNKCIRCHCLPDSTIKIAQNSQNPFLVFFLPILWIFGWSRVEVPICKKCKPRFRLQRWGRELGCWVLILTAVWFIYPHFKDWSRFTRRIVVGALVIIAITPYVLAEVIWPRIFETTARKDSVDYEFASAGYAAEFHELNEEHVLESEVSG